MSTVAAPTAADVLAGVDLRGRLAIVTGGYSGLGLAAARALAGAGARVVVPARRPDAARDALDGVEVDALDLADLESVAAFAERFLTTGRTIDIAICGAGVMACPETRVGPGWEAQFATNHLGHYALVNRLRPAIARGGRVVVVASGLDRAALRWDDVHFRRGYDKWEAYAQSKLANVLFAARLDALARRDGVHAFSVDPGYILTPLQRHLTTAEMVDSGWIDQHGTPLLDEFVTPEQGAATQVWAATAPELAASGGAYCRACAVADRVDGDDDRAAAARLWALSAELTGVDAFASASR